MNEIRNIILICIAASILVLCIGTVFTQVEVERPQNIFKIRESYFSGIIRGCIEPTENDDMYLYLILCSDYSPAELKLYALPEKAYLNCPDTFQEILDSRETSCYMSGYAGNNESDTISFGYDYINVIAELNTKLVLTDNPPARTYFKDFEEKQASDKTSGAFFCVFIVPPKNFNFFHSCIC